MSQIERRLSQEMQAIAERIGPGDLRPLRPPPPSAWSINSRYWLGPAAAMAAVALVTSGVFVARHALNRHQAPSAATVPRAVPDPAVVAVSNSSSQVRLLSAATGRLVKLVSVAVESNGFALAPDAKSMFVVGLSLTLSQVTVATGQAKVIDTTGAYPAVSPDSRYVAYATGASFTQVAVRDLYSGRTRAISLAALLGARSSLLNQGGLTWLGNGSQIVAVSEPDPITTYVLPVRQPAVLTSRRTACGQQNSPHGLCVIVINVAPTRLFARRLFLPHLIARLGVDLISGDLTAARSFFIGQSGLPAAVVDKVRLQGWTPVVRPYLTLPSRTFGGAMAPDGDRVIYVRTGSTPSLWMATVRGARLVRTHRLLVDGGQFQFDAVAW